MSELSNEKEATLPRKKTPQAPAFEESLEQLEQIVERLESGDLPLEESLKLFEQGIQLTRSCQTSLKQAEEKINVLTKQNNDWLPSEDDEVEDTLSTS